MTKPPDMAKLPPKRQLYAFWLVVGVIMQAPAAFLFTLDGIYVILFFSILFGSVRVARHKGHPFVKFLPIVIGMVAIEVFAELFFLAGLM